MYNESKELLWETFLKSAVIENSIKELNTYPDSKDLKNIQIPKSYDYKMRKLINRLNFQRKFLSALHVAQKAVSIILIITGASFIFLLQNHDVRAACKNFITKIYEQYIHLSYKNDISNNIILPEFGYIPNGFSLVEISSNQNQSTVIYKDSLDNRIVLYSYSTKHDSSADNENYNIYEIEINNFPGLLFESKNSYFENMLYWNTDSTYYQLKSSLPSEELIKIAENLN